jgi:hypothetical protein
MKKILCLLFFVFGYVSFGQNPIFTNRLTPNLSSGKFKPFSFQINFNKNDLFSKADNLTIYNPVTNLNDNYYILGRTYTISTIKSIPSNGFIGPRIDSLNPSGTKDFGSAVALGVLNFIFGKL